MEDLSDGIDQKKSIIKIMRSLKSRGPLSLNE